MDNQHYLRTKYLPFRPDAFASSNSQTNQPSVQPQPKSGQVVGHIYQNVCIGGGMMTQKIPITSNLPVQLNLTPVVHIASPVVINRQSLPQSTNFISPVNLIGSTGKVVQQPVQSKKWSSSGTIIIEDSYNRRNGKTCQAIFLGKNPYTNMYELFYGKRDNGDTSEESTAIRETKEESSNMFVFTPDMYDSRYSVSSTNSLHCAFVIRVKAPRGGIQSTVFARNQQVLKSNNAPCEWTELSDLTRIDISEAINWGLLTHTKGNFTMPDVYGNPIVIFSRDAEFIGEALRQNMHSRGNVNQLTFVSSWDDRRVGGNKMYLNGTSCYKH